MNPINNPWLPKEPSPREKKMQAEIEAFLESGCEFAELWMDETVTPNRNRTLYYDVRRRQRIYGVEFRQCNNKIVAVRATEK